MFSSGDLLVATNINLWAITALTSIFIAATTFLGFSGASVNNSMTPSVAQEMVNQYVSGTVAGGGITCNSTTQTCTWIDQNGVSYALRPMDVRHPEQAATFTPDNDGHVVLGVESGSTRWLLWGEQFVAIAATPYVTQSNNRSFLLFEMSAKNYYAPKISTTHSIYITLARH